MKHFTRGVVNQNTEEILKCNELFCNTSIAGLAEDGSGGGVLKSLEVLGDAIIKNEQAENERKKQEREIAEVNRLLAEERLLTPPSINWDSSVAFRYEGIVNRHKQISGN